MLYEEAKSQQGIFSQVVGGDCTHPNRCASTFASLGCRWKVVDPARRYQVERYKQWALQEIEFAKQECLWSHLEYMLEIVRDCELDIERMDRIEAYRADEKRVAQIRIKSK